MFLFFYNHVLWSLAVTFETVIDMTIDSPVKTWIMIFVKPIWSCPPDCTIFILFTDVTLLLVNLYSYTHVLSQALFNFVQPHYLVIFVNLYDHMPYFITCINFILLNLLYSHICTIMCLMYDIFVLLYVFYFVFFLFMYDTDKCIYRFYIVVL